MTEPGPVCERLLATLSEIPLFCDYRDGRITQDEYLAGLQARREELEHRLGGPRQLGLLASRFPRDMANHPLELFSDLRAQGFVNGEPDAAAYAEFRERMAEEYDHGENRTFIQHDEGGLAYLIAMDKRPKHMVTIGSYYGYWAVWAMPGVEAGDGDAALIDPNPKVCELAEKNFAALGYGERTAVLNARGEDVVDQLPDGIDLVLLDAAGGREHPDPRYHGKGIYALLATSVFPKMADRALLLAHNDYRSPVGVNPLSRPYIERSTKQLELFHSFCDDHFRRGMVLDTPDGFGVYMK